MADLFQGLVAYLSLTANVTAYCGNSIQPIPAPANLEEYPALTMQTASDVSGYTLTGLDGVTTSRVVFNCIAQQYGDARGLALAVKAALSGYSGTLPNGTQIFQSRIVNMQDGYDDGSRLSTSSVHALIAYSD
jgi:hypothetical protein